MIGQFRIRSHAFPLNGYMTTMQGLSTLLYKMKQLFICLALSFFYLNFLECSRRTNSEYDGSSVRTSSTSKDSSGRTVETRSYTTVSNFEDNYIEEEEEEDTIPHFVTETMSSRELLESLKEILRLKFDPFTVSVYLHGIERTDFLNIAMILNGMISHGQHDIYEEMLGLWGYYLTLQKHQSIVAQSNIYELISNNKHFAILDGLLRTCKSLNILSEKSKESIINEIMEYTEERIDKYAKYGKHIETQNCGFVNLKMKSLEYLFGMTREEILEKYKGTGLYEPFKARYDVISYDLTTFYHDMNTIE